MQDLIQLALDALAADDKNQILNAIRIISLALPEEYTEKALKLFFDK